MAAFVLTTQAAITCSHAGRVQHPMTAPRARAAGMPLLVGNVPSMVVGCPQPPPPVGPGPCHTARWVTTSVRVRTMGLPLLLQNSAAMTAPVGGPVVIMSAGQTRVRAT